MIASRILACLALLALPGCKDKDSEPAMPRVSQVFPKLPLPPQATVLSRTGGPEAIQLSLRSPAKAKDVETYYRAVLSRDGWRLVNDMRDRDGSVVLLAQQDGPPLWVRIKSTDDSVATIVELSGAVVPDTGKVAKPAS